METGCDRDRTTRPKQRQITCHWIVGADSEAKPISGQRHVPAASTGRTYDRKQFGLKNAAPTLQTQGRPHMLRELCSLAMPSEFDLITL